MEEKKLTEWEIYCSQFKDYEDFIKHFILKKREKHLKTRTVKIGDKEVTVKVFVK